MWSIHALRKKIAGLYADAEDDNELAEVYKLVHNEVDAVMASSRLQARVESSVRASTSARQIESSDAQSLQPEKREDAQSDVGADTPDKSAVSQGELREVAAAES